MVKSLINKLKDKVVKGALVLTAMASLTGCPNPVITNYAPEATVSASPNAVKKGESVYLTVDGTDANEKEDIIEYRLDIDKDNDGDIDETYTQSTPICNKLKTFDEVGTAKVYGTVKDNGGLTNRKETSITISPSEDIPSSELPNVTLENKELFDKRISYVDLPNPTDNDTSGIIPYTSVKVLKGEGYVTPTLNGNQLSLQAGAVSHDEDYQVELTFGSEQGGRNKATLEGKIKPLCDIVGRLESNENDGTLQAGEIRLYDGTTLLGSTSTDGNFSIQADYSPASEIKLKARVKINGIDGYVRTITLDGTKDYSVSDNITVRAVPAPDFGNTNKVDFKEFMNRVNFGAGVSSNPFSGLKKWNFGEFPDITDKFEGIEILKTNPMTGDEFTEGEQIAIEGYIRNSGYSRAGKIKIDKNEVREHCDLNLSPSRGWGIIAPASSIFVDEIKVDGSTTTYDSYTDSHTPDGYLDGFVSLIGIKDGNIRRDITNENLYKPLVIHESLHGELYPGHALESDNSVMKPICDRYTMQPADIKGNQLIEEDTYKGMENIDDILGIDFPV